MAFFVDMAPSCQAYLDSQLGWERHPLEQRIVASLENCSDAYRDARRLPLLPGSTTTYFQVDYLFLSRQGVLPFLFVVSEAGAAMGVLQIVYVERADH